jgi:hypothetical protein
LKATLRLPLARVIGHPLMGMAIAGFFFGGGWFMRYSVKHGIGGAAVLFQDRLSDAVALKPKPPKPSPSPSASAAPPTTTTTPVPVASATPKPPPRVVARPPEQITVKNDLLDLIDFTPELQKSDKQSLKQLVSSWKNPGAAEVVVFFEALDKLVYVKQAIRRDIMVRVLSLGTVSPLFKLTKQEEPTRIAKGWDVPDMRKAFDKGGALEVKNLGNGRPAQFFIELSKDWPAYQVCRENLTNLKDGKAVPVGADGAPATPAPSPAASVNPDGPTPEAPSAVECPARGTYEPRGKGVWHCSVHQTLDQPFARAAALSWYIEPTEEAIKAARTTDPTAAVGILEEVLTIHPNQIWAVNGIADIMAEYKNWPRLKMHLERYMGKDPINARWGFLMAQATHGQIDFEGAKKWAVRTQNAAYATPPPNITRILDFYLYKDRALEIYNAAQGSVRPEEWPFQKDDQQPSSLCVRNLTEVKTAVGKFVTDYPASHPDLTPLRQKQAKAQELLKTTPPGPKLEAIKPKAKAIDDRIALLMSDKDGKLMWRSLAKFLSGYAINGCPAGGRYTLERHQWLDCSKHSEILGERLEWGKRAAPTPDEEIQLSRSILNGALAADPKRKACFQTQKEYVASRGSEGVQPGEVTTSTKLPNGQPLACGSGAMQSVAISATQAIVRCDFHGSYEEYFKGVGEATGEAR